MKTTIEVNGYEIVIEETDGMVSVSAMKDDEIVEEFQLEADSESFDGDDDMESDVKDFDDFEGEDGDSFDGEEEEDFDSDDMGDDGEDEGEDEGDDDDDDSDEMEEEEGKLESFQSFLKKRK